MYGASIASQWASEYIGESAVILLPVAGSSSISLIPLQNEPNVSHNFPSASKNAAGSIVLKSSFSRDCTTIPPSVHLYAGSSGSSVGLLATPIADVFFPKLDAE